MIRINGFYLYSVGANLRPLREINVNTPFSTAGLTLFFADSFLNGLLNQSVFRPKTSYQKGNELLLFIKDMLKMETNEPDKTKTFEQWRVWSLANLLNEFEAVLAAEFGLSDFYLVLKKRGYDTTDLIEHGDQLFPAELSQKVPEAIDDVKFGARCLAFELYTASGFHFHRANESVLHRYYDTVALGKKRPSGRNIGQYLAALDKHKVGEAKVISALRDLKDLHRNPLIHPGESINNLDEAIALLGQIQSAMISMLKAIPLPKLATLVAGN